MSWLPERISPDLILRSIAKRCVSKDGVATELAAILRDAASAAPQDEVGVLWASGQHNMVAFGQFLEVFISGLLSGVLYSLVALGFVLIFKASGVFNFAQGAMVLLAGLALVRSLDLLVAKGFPFWTAVVAGSRCSPPSSWRSPPGWWSASCSGRWSTRTA